MGTAVDKASDAEMIAVLRRQKFNDAIPALADVFSSANAR